MQTHKFKWKLFDVEYSSVKIWELEESDKRMDSEFYSTENIENIIKINSHNYKFLNQLSNKITDWTHFTPKYTESGIPFLSALNVLENTIEYKTFKYISIDEHNKLVKRAYVEEWDILLRKVWVWARFAWVVTYKPFDYSIFVSVALLKLSNEYKSLNYYISTFINSFYWQFQLLRFNKWISQPDLHLEDIAKLKIPIPSQSFQEKIQELVIDSYKQKELSETLYKEAENLLLQELDLLDYKVKTKNINLVSWYSLEMLENHSTINYSILKELDRFDAEYWDYSYFEIIDKIKKYKWWFDKLTNLVKVSKKKITLDEEEVYNYIELADINKSNWMVENITEILWKDLPSRARMKIERWSVLFSSLEGSIDKVAIIDNDIENLVASTWFFIFKENILNKETLLVLLKIFWQKYISREALGTIMSAISNTWIERILLPKIENNIQKIITQKIQDSFIAKTKSKNLLEIAKKSVEIYIEEDEEKGFEFIKNNV